MGHPYTIDTRQPVLVDHYYYVVPLKKGCGFSNFGILPHIMKVYVQHIGTDYFFKAEWNPSMQEVIEWDKEVQKKECFTDCLWPNKKLPPKIILRLQNRANCLVYRRYPNSVL